MSDVVAQTMARLQEMLFKASPEMRDLLEKEEGGPEDPGQALNRILEGVSKDPKLAAQFMQIAQVALAPLTDVHNHHSIGGALFHSGRGLPQVNPLVQASIAERLQFDGDIPEMRAGPLPPEMLPARPVHAAVRNPVLLGQIMREEAHALNARIRGHQVALFQEVAASEALRAPGAPLHPMLTGGSSDLDHPEYRRGAVPSAMEVASWGTDLSTTDAQAQEALRDIIATTQGRRSACHVIARMVHDALVQAGLNVVLLKTKENLDPGKILVSHMWTMHPAGIPEMQPQFNPIDTAASVLIAACLGMAKGVTSPLTLVVFTVDTLADREVGWGAWLCRS
jgi:hypothetical protein